MGKKSRLKRNKRKLVRVRADEVLTYGPLKIARYGRFIRFENCATAEQHAELLQKVAEAHKQVLPRLADEVAQLQALVAKYDPVELLHRAAYMLLPLFMKYQSESEYPPDESYYLPIVEYLQYLVARTPSTQDGKSTTEEEWDALWGLATKVLHSTQEYLFTRRAGNPPSEIDELRFSLDCRRLMVRINRFPLYFADHLRDSLAPYQDTLFEAYGSTVDDLIRGLEEINTYQRTGVIERYGAMKEASELLMLKLMEKGCKIGPEASPEEIEQTHQALNTPEFLDLRKDAEEKARLALTPAIFDITDVTSLPKSVLSLLSIRGGELVLTKLSGPNHDDLSPLSTSVLHHKPFVEHNGRFYFFYHSGFEDRIVEIIEKNLFTRFPGRATSLRRRRDEYQEALATDLLVSVIKPDIEYRNVYYPDPDQMPDGITEVDAILATDDVLFLVEIKAGGFSAAANRGAPDSLYDELADTIGKGQQQSERAERYIKSANETPFFDSTGKTEVVRLRRNDYRQIFRVVVTRENLGWVGARIAVLSVIDPRLSSACPWHVSLDDLRVVAELFKDNSLRFVHFLEQRLRASLEPALTQHDEIEHVGLYNKINLYHDLPAKDMDSMTFDASYMRDIEVYFSERARGETPDLPRQHLPSNLAHLIQALSESNIAGRFEFASIVLSLDAQNRNQLNDAIKHLDAGRSEGKRRSVRLPISSDSVGITITYAEGSDWNREQIISAAQMQRSSCNRWLVLQLASNDPYTFSKIERMSVHNFKDEELAQGHAYLERAVQEIILNKSIRRNDSCPCGSGRKYKKCHGK